MTELERLTERLRRLPMIEGCLDDLQREVIVRAILTAMREPSKETMLAGCNGIDMHDEWQAMLDHILAGGE